jgi:hypothetical protein
MKYNIKKHLIISTPITVLVYLIFAFVNWDIALIMKIGSYEGVVRVWISLIFLTIHSYVALHVYHLKK